MKVEKNLIQAVVLGVFLTTGSWVMAQDAAPTVPKVPADVKADHQEIKAARQEIKADTKEIRADRKDRREALKAGDKAAVKAETKAIHEGRKERRHDIRDLHHAKKDLRHDRKAHKATEATTESAATAVAK